MYRQARERDVLFQRGLLQQRDNSGKREREREREEKERKRAVEKEIVREVYWER